MKVLVGFILFKLFFLSSAKVVLNIDDSLDKYNLSVHKHANVGSAINIKSFVTKYGYPFEEYSVTTGDQYILKMHRIPYGNINNDTKNRPPVLLMHCIYCTSAVFVMLGPENSLAFQLAEEGYDVWLGNNRGNTYSKKHNFLNPKENASFWDFSFHELGYEDDVAMIDFVLSKTRQKKLSYVGYSQGTSQFFVMASTKPEYQDKVNFMAALAPIAYMNHASHPVLPLAKKLFPFLQSILAQRNIMEILEHSTLVNIATDMICGKEKYEEICALVTFVVGGFDSAQLNRTDLTTILDVLPGGGSVKELVHFFQLINSGHFRQYDYGKMGNVDRYNQLNPPEYNLSSITVPVALFYSQNDLFASIIDVERLAESLPNSEKHLINYTFFTHLDFIIAKDLHSLLNFELINTLNLYNNKSELTTTATKSTTKTPQTTTTEKPETTTKGSGFVTKSSLINSFIGFVCLYFLL